MKVNVYTDALKTSARFGLGRHAHEIIEALSSRGDQYVISSTIGVSGAGFEKAVKLRGRKALIGSWALTDWPHIETLTSDFDVLFQTDLSFNVATKQPKVVTIHDLGPISHPHYFSESHPWLLEQAVKKLVNATKIIAVSETTADAIVAHTAGKVRRDEIIVAYQGVSDFTGSLEATEEEVVTVLKQRPYFFWAGAISPRKNLARVIAAFESLPARFGARLVICGANGWESDAIATKLKKLSQEGKVIILGYVSEAMLGTLYRHACALVFPSLMEGFGFPVVEAMKNLCPVITSRISSTEEVAGDAAILVNPLEIREISDAMIEIFESNARAEDLREMGVVRAKDFSWTRYRNTVLQTLRSAADQ